MQSSFSTAGEGRPFLFGPNRRFMGPEQMKLTDLQEQRELLANKIREFSKEKYDQDKADWKSPEDFDAWKQLNADYDDVMSSMNDESTREKQRLEVQNRLSQIQEDGGKLVAKVTGTKQPSLQRETLQRRGEELEAARAQGMATWFKAQLGMDYSDEEVENAREVGIRVGSAQLRFQTPNTASLNAFYRAWARQHPAARSIDFFNAPLTTGTAATGGNLIPAETLLQRIEVNLLAFGGVRENAEIISTTSGEPLSWPTVNDTGNSGRLVAESTSVDDNAGGGSAGDGGPNPVFGKTQWDSYKYTSDTILVPTELLEDSVIDLPRVIGDLLGERLGRITNTHYTTGTGTAQPSGIVTGSTLGVTAASGTAITKNEIYALQHSVDPAYRNGASFMMKDSTILYVRQLEDGNGLPLWANGFQAGVPDQLAGSPIVVNQDMAAIAINAKTILYGQLMKYKIRRVNGLRLYRMGEHYRSKDQDGFVAFIREDGGLLDAGTPPVKHLVQAAV